MPPSERTKRIVWVKFGGRCAICREVLCIPGISTGFSHLIGDIAHNVAEQNDGARGNSELTLEERNSESNLLLLCLPHHRLIDDAPSNYTVGYLQEISTKHHDWVTSCLSSTQTWKTRLFHLYYINVPRLSLLTALGGQSLDLSEFGDIKALHEIGWDLNRILAGFRHLLEQVELHAVPLHDALNMNDPRGLVVSFDQEFRTKNIRIPDSQNGYGKPLSGNLQTDPHIYSKDGDIKVIANIDLRWVTTTTAFVQFRPSSGKNRFAGLGFVNSVDKQGNSASISPYLIGMPSNPFLEEFYGLASTTK